MKNYRGDKICPECRERFRRPNSPLVLCCSYKCSKRKHDRQTLECMNRKSAKSFAGTVRYFKLMNRLHDLRLPELEC